MTKRNIATILSAAAMTLSIGTQAVTVKELFSTMPDSLLPTLTRNDRLDLLDYAESKLPSKVQNIYDEAVGISYINDSLLTLAETAATRVDLFTLPLSGHRDSVIIGMLKTYKVGEEESHIRFYTTEWQEIPAAKLIKQPQTADFIKTKSWNSNKDLKSALSRADIPMISLTPCGTSNSGNNNDSNHCNSNRTKDSTDKSKDNRNGHQLEARISMDGGFHEIRAQLQGHLRDRITYIWNGKKYIKQSATE